MEAKMAATTTTRKLGVRIDKRDFFFSVAPTDTIFDARAKMLSLPRDAGFSLASWPEFSIALDGRVLTRKEELSILVCSAIEEKKYCSLHDLASEENQTGGQEESSERPVKRPRSDDYAKGKPKSSDLTLFLKQNEDAYTSDVMAGKFPRTPDEVSNVAATKAPSTDEDSQTEKEPAATQVLDLTDEDAQKMSEADGDSINCMEVNEDDDDEHPLVDAPEDSHVKNGKAIFRSKERLVRLREILHDPLNRLFCSNRCRQDWSNELDMMMNKSPEDVIIGCLGRTGVGKSSLLNALLDEPDILPTSGSRGCTAAVVELRYNRSFLELTDESVLTVYRGQVEFISMQEWIDELEVLLEDCCSNGTETILARAPDEEVAAAAWAKINQVYGHGKMESFRKKPKVTALAELTEDTRVVQLLTGSDGKPNTILVEEGVIDASKGKLLMENFANLKGKLRREQKKWAKIFRSKINDYVYRKGNGKEPQTWPLIRKVVLHGPWDVLKTGACLVDLPGVQDANAARAKVAQSYIQNCHRLWIFAHIKRAVDDKTAKDLMGETFKRHLLMDGQYGNVGFICTHSDDCETTEIMRDHEDVARSEAGRWERMVGLFDQIGEVEQERNDLFQHQEDLRLELEDVKQEIKELQKEIKAMKFASAGENDKSDSEQAKDLKEELRGKKKDATGLKAKVKGWERDNSKDIEKLQEKAHSYQKVLKAVAAKVRNEYSTKCLQEDFRQGLDDLIRKPEDGEEEYKAPSQESVPPVPANFTLEVHCVASNDYLKIQGIKATLDGPSNTFDCAADTQIPLLRAAVHNATARFQDSFVRDVVGATADLLERAKLCAAENQEHSPSTQKFKHALEDEMKGLESKTKQIASELNQKSENLIIESLHPVLLAGAEKGNSAAMSTIASWGSNDRRSKYENGKGLAYKTYEATMKRSGAFVSSAAGFIDLNQELCDPMEKEFSAKWQEVIDGAIIKNYLPGTKARFDSLCNGIIKTLAKRLDEAGGESSFCSAMLTTARRACEINLCAKFEQIEKTATQIQREVHRYLKERTAQRMIPQYKRAASVPRGTGAFGRMKNSLERKAKGAYERMFDRILNELSTAIGQLLKALQEGILDVARVIHDSFMKVCSAEWQSQQLMNDVKMMKEIRACKDRLIPVLNTLCVAHHETMALVGIEHREVDFEVVGVDTWEEKNAREMQEAKEMGLYVDLVTSADEEEEPLFSDLHQLVPVRAKGFVKAEPDLVESTGTESSSQKLGPALPGHVAAHAEARGNRESYCVETFSSSFDDYLSTIL